MDELTYKFLKANGYDYNYGGIIDAEGNYVSILELNGKTIKSELSLEEFTRFRDQDTKLNEDKEKVSSQDEKLKVLENLEKKELPKTSESIGVNSNFPMKEVYKFSLVLSVSLVIYILIKKLIK